MCRARYCDIFMFFFEVLFFFVCMEDSTSAPPSILILHNDVLVHIIKFYTLSHLKSLLSLATTSRRINELCKVHIFLWKSRYTAIRQFVVDLPDTFTNQLGIKFFNNSFSMYEVLNKLKLSTKLHFEHLPFNDNIGTFAYTFELLGNLKILNINDCGIGDTGLTALSNAIAKLPNVSRLYKNQIGRKEMKSSAAISSGSLRALEELPHMLFHSGLDLGLASHHHLWHI